MIVNKQAKESMRRQHTICNINRRATTGGSEGEVSPALFQNLENALILGKNALTRFIFGFNFSFKILF